MLQSLGWSNTGLFLKSMNMAISLPHENDIELSALPYPGERCDNINENTAFDRGQSDIGFPAFPEGGLRAWLVVLGSFCGM
jgi:hypothetical protein